ncbi:MAG: glycosyltransferase family 4 protein [Candidatus Acidiferrales bacterium]
MALMASPLPAEIDARPSARVCVGKKPSAPATAITLCHFSTAHTQLKSRSFHRQFLPLAAAGFKVQYISPARAMATHDGIEFVTIRKRNSRLARFLGSVPLFLKLLQQPASVYHFQDPELLPAALLLKLVFRKRVVYDAYEDFPSMARDKASIPQPLRSSAARLVRAIEKLAARCFDGVMTADPCTLRRLAHTGRSRKLVFYNFPNLDFFPHPAPQRKPFDVVYRGGLSERAGTFLLLDAAAGLVRQGHAIRLLLIGYFDSASAESALRRRIRGLGLDSSVEILGRIRHEEMAQALCQARIGVSPLSATPKFLLNIPVKIFEYWACGLPVIASDLPPIRPFLCNTHAGLLFPPGNSHGLALSIRWMLEHPHTAERMGCRGRSAVVERFNNHNETQKLARFCLSIANSH